MGYDIVSMVPMFCEVFLGDSDVEGGLAFPDRIDRETLDYKLEAIDEDHDGSGTRTTNVQA